MQKRLFIVLLLFVASCGQSVMQKDKTSVVAYADLAVLYDFVLEHDQDYAAYKDILIRKRKDGTPLTEAEEQIKKAVLLEIDSAVRFVARDKKVDLVVNKSDSLLYGSTSSDITQLVLNELKVRIYRNSPSSK